MSTGDDTLAFRLRVSLVAIASLGLLGGWLWLRAGATQSASTPTAVGLGRAIEARESPGPVPTTDPVPTTVQASANLGSRLLGTLQAAQEPPMEAANDGIAVMGPGQSDSTAGGARHPHPLTPVHQRIFRENAILSALDGAVDAGDSVVLRQLNRQYREAYPEDPQQLQDGYDLIADCLERAEAAPRARAERYFAEQRASTLRRYVQRHCLM